MNAPLARFVRLLMLALMLSLASVRPAFAQDDGGGAGPSVLRDSETEWLFRDVSRALIKAGGQNQQKAADAEGKAHFEGLAGGVYIVTAAPDGYAEVTCPGVRVVGQSRQVEIHLLPKDGAEPSSCKVMP
jgi:hypothetical protein